MLRFARLVSLLTCLLPFTTQACHHAKHRCGGGPEPKCEIPANQYESGVFDYNGSQYRLTVVIGHQPIVVFHEVDSGRAYYYIRKPRRPHGNVPKGAHKPQHANRHSGQGHHGVNRKKVKGKYLKPRHKPICIGTTFRHTFDQGPLNPYGLFVNLSLVSGILSGEISAISGNTPIQMTPVQLQPTLSATQ